MGPVAHGGSCVARHEGRAVFVRHALPGERVRARVTEGGEEDRFWRADAVEILSASADRVEAPCPFAGPGRCGGCDWQHASLPAQRRLKGAVVEEQLRRLAGIDWPVVVEPVEGDDGGLGWRTRVTYAVDDAGRDMLPSRGRKMTGRAGLRKHRSHDVVPIDRCLVAHPGVRSVGVEARRWPGATSVEVVAASSGERMVTVSGPDHGLEADLRRSHVTEHAAGRSWRVSAGGFWQVHPGAAQTLVDAVLDALRPMPGEQALDLYCGVGLFAGALAERVHPGGSVVAVEGSRRAVADARRNLRDLPWVQVVVGRVDRVLAGAAPPSSADRSTPSTGKHASVDLVVLDPPRAGAKSAVVAAIVDRAPRAVAYVACDPAALARDLATFQAAGYRLTDLRAFDLFPMTHHVECVAVLHPASRPAAVGAIDYP